MTAVATAATPDDAGTRLAALLGVTPEEARAVLELRLLRFTESEVAVHRAEREEILRGLSG